jgi:hypothetical protein
MKKLFTLVSLLMVASALTFGNEIKEQSQSSKVVGVWKSFDDVNGEPQAVIAIKNNGNKLEGHFVFRGLTVEGKDNVTLEFPLANVTFDGTLFSFNVTFPEPEKTVTDWELKLRSDNEAGLAMTKEEGKPVEEALTFLMKRANGN